MNLRDLKDLVEQGKVLQVFSGAVYEKSGLFTVETKFGGIPEYKGSEVYTWDDIKQLKDNITIKYLLCYDEHRQPVNFLENEGWYYGYKTKQVSSLIS